VYRMSASIMRSSPSLNVLSSSYILSVNHCF
jgi:hypothetical protein